METDVQVRSLLESFTTLQHVSNESSVKLKMSADLVDHVEFKGSTKTLQTLPWSKKKIKGN